MVGGERKSDEVNFAYFDNKSVPPLAVLVSGGALTTESHDRIAESIETLKGVENWHKMLVLEAEPPTGMTAADMMHMGSNITPKVDFKPLTEAQHGDALFQKYKATARDNVRSACGIPPILIGESQDYTRATAMTAMQVAEQFMFGPLRNEWDDRLNRLLLPELELRYWLYRSGTPDLTNIEDVARAIEVGNQVGVGNPNVYSQVLERVLGVELPQNDAPWAQFPVDLVKIALQSGLVTLDFSDGGLDAQVNDEAREAFKATVGEVIEEAFEMLLLKARKTRTE
jgi:capsid portal protein